MGRLCPQEYSDIAAMRATPCTRCSVGWNAALRQCTIATGAEHFPLVPAAEVPSCPLEDRCQHQVQRVEPCPIRARGMICESALLVGGMTESEAADHPLAFNADVAASPEEWAEIEAQLARGLDTSL